LGVAVFAAGSAGSTRADDPAGSYSIVFSGNQQIWNLEESFDGCVEYCEFEPGVGLTCVDLCIDTVLSTDGRGRLSGYAEVSLAATLGGAPLMAGVALCAVGGKTAGRDSTRRTPESLTKFFVRARCQGQTDVSGLGLIRTRVTESWRGVVDSSGSLRGQCKVRGCLRKLGCFADAEDVADSLPDGSWTLNLSITNVDGKRLGGTATDSLGHTYEIKGAYDAGTDESRLKLRAANDESKGASVLLKKLAVVGGSIDRGEVRYNIRGHKGRAVLGP
jgi:hypothetical protein